MDFHGMDQSPAWWFAGVRRPASFTGTPDMLPGEHWLPAGMTELNAIFRRIAADHAEEIVADMKGP